MKSLQVELPDKLALEVDTVVKAGWFSNETDVIHHALFEFLRRNRLTLLERFQQEDLAWIRRQKQSAN